jgi:adenine-specific DNA glycosylase
LAGVQEKIPRKKKRPKIETVTLSQFVIQQGRRILLVHRQGEKQLHGFWDFPSLTPPEGKKGKHSLAKALQRELGIEIPDLRKLADLEHGITRFRYRIQVWRVEIAPGRRPLLPGQGCHWVKASDLGKYPMALVARKIAAMV